MVTVGMFLYPAPGLTTFPVQALYKEARMSSVLFAALSHAVKPKPLMFRKSGKGAASTLSAVHGPLFREIKGSKKLGNISRTQQFWEFPSDSASNINILIIPEYLQCRMNTITTYFRL
jgi:hypothetical protein